MNKSIKSSVQSAIIFNVIISASIITIITAFIFSSTSFKENEIQAKSLVASYSLSISEAISSIENQIKNAASNSNICDNLIPLDDRKSYLKLATRNTVFNTLSVSDKNGKTYEDTDIANEDYFINALKGETYIAAVGTDDTPILMAGSELTSVGPSGVIFGTIDVNYFNKYTTKIKLGKTGIGFIVDKNGNLISHPDEELLNNHTNLLDNAQKNKNAEYKLCLSNIVNGKSGREIYSENGVKKIVTYAPIECAEGWSLVICQNYDDVVDACYKTIFISILVLIALSLLSLFFSHKIANSLSKPIQAVVNRLELLSQGDLNSPIPNIKAKSEINILLRTLDSTIFSIKSYITDITFVLENISNGNLCIQSNQEYSGDFKPIKNSLSEILYSLNTIFNDIKSTVVSVKESSEQVSVSSAVISNNASVEASTIEELTSTINIITNDVKQSASNTNSATQLFHEMQNSILLGNENMIAMHTAINLINTSYGNISKIIRIIDDIAFQTNILALNASVEAARAGPAGKGFAVVANEVRNLAQKSANAAKEIENFISESKDSVTNGTTYSKKTSEVLLEIVQMTQNAATFMDEILISSNQQADSISQIEIGMNQITSSIQTNSSIAEENSSVSETLYTEADLLSQKIHRFKLF